MRALVLEKVKTPLKLLEVSKPIPQKKEILVKVAACAICRTDLHVIDGDLPHPKLPLIPGHQIVGKVVELGDEATHFKMGDRVGIPWLGKTCGKCFYCKSNQENLCDHAFFTGYQLNGGYAEYCIAHEDYAFSVPTEYSDVHVAPLLCSGLVGFRAYRMMKDAKNVGFYGFGSSAHLLIQVAHYEKRKVFCFSRKGNQKNQEFAKSLGAYWTGDSETEPTEKLDAAIIFAPVGSLVPVALKAIRKGGIVVCAGIHMSDIPSFSYSLLWGEKKLCSVANLTRKDATDFLILAPKIPIKTNVTTYPLEKANSALKDFREGKISGTAVLIP